jgi:hypothetical protein
MNQLMSVQLIFLTQIQLEDGTIKADHIIAALPAKGKLTFTKLDH